MKNKLSSRFKINKKTENQQLKFENNPIEIPTPMQDENIQEDLKTALLEKIDSTPVWFEYSKDKQIELIRTFLNNKIGSDKLIEKDNIMDNLLNSVSDFGEIQHLLDSENVSKVVINDTNNVFVEINNKFLDTEIKLSEKQLKLILKKISSLGITEFKGFQSCKNDKYKITLIGTDICSGINICIKKIKNFDIEYLIKNKILTQNIYNLIINLIEQNKNIIIFGPENSGKTVILNAIIKSLSDKRRLAVIDSFDEINSVVNIFQTKIQDKDFENIISYIKNIPAETVISDTNKFDTRLIFNNSVITTKQNSVEGVLRQIFSAYINDGLTDKFARTQGLTDINYIIKMGFNKDGSPILSSIIELTPAKSMSQSLRTLVSYKNGKYETYLSDKKAKLKIS